MKLLSGLLICCAAATGQDTLSQTFEVASVKRSGPQSVRLFGGGPGTSDPGQIRATKANLRDLIAQAYGVEHFQISGPSWIQSEPDTGSDIYDVFAKVPEGATKEQAKIMMQNLLAERFHLLLRHETKEFPVFELVIAKGGIKFKDAGPTGLSERPDWPSLPGNRPSMLTNFRGGHARLRAHDQPVAMLVRMLKGYAGRPVIDSTGLNDRYDIELDWDPRGISAPADDQPDAAPLLSVAIEKQLGLKFQDARRPFEVLAVEKADRIPVEN